MLERLREPWSDQRAERVLGALACVVLVTIALMIIFVFKEAWPMFQHNGLKWLGPGGDVDQQIGNMVNASGSDATHYYLRAWPLIWATLLTTGFAVLFGMVFSVLAAIFIVEFAPDRLRNVIVPVVRLLAAVPSVIFGLIGILVLVPFVGQHIITAGNKKSVEFVIPLTGASLLVSIVILTVMIVPIMIAINVDALYSVPRGWKEGAVALGVNRWRAIWTVSVRAAKPAFIAGAVLAAARALGEAIMLSMVSGSKGFAPNPFDGPLFFLEPLRPLAASIVEGADSMQAPGVRASIYGFALLLLAGSFFLSIAGYIAKQPMKKYGIRV